MMCGAWPLCRTRVGRRDGRTGRIERNGNRRRIVSVKDDPPAGRMRFVCRFLHAQVREVIAHRVLERRARAQMIDDMALQRAATATAECFGPPIVDMFALVPL